AAEHREMQDVRSYGDDDAENEQRVGQERIAADHQEPAVREPEEGRAAQAERPSLDDGLRDAADEEHSAEGHDEGLQIQSRDEKPLDEADEERDPEADGDPHPER